MVAWKTPGPFGYADRKWLYLIHSMFVYSGKKESTTSIKYYINFAWHWIASTCTHGWPKDSHTNKRWSLRSTHASTENDKSPLKLTDETKLFIFVVFTRDRITQFPCLCVARSFYSALFGCFLLVYITFCVCLLWSVQARSTANGVAQSKPHAIRNIRHRMTTFFCARQTARCRRWRLKRVKSATESDIENCCAIQIHSRSWVEHLNMTHFASMKWSGLTAVCKY